MPTNIFRINGQLSQLSSFQRAANHDLGKRTAKVEMENVMDMPVVFQIWVKDYKGLIRF